MAWNERGSLVGTMVCRVLDKERVAWVVPYSVSRMMMLCGEASRTCDAERGYTRSYFWDR